MFWQNKKNFDFLSLIFDSRNILTASLKSSGNRHCCRCFLQLGQRASTCTFDRLFVRFLTCVWGFVCRLSKHFSTVYSVVIVCAGHIRLLFKLLQSFEMYKNIPRAEAPLLVIKISKKSQQRGRFSFALKRNETTCM